MNLNVFEFFLFFKRRKWNCPSYRTRHDRDINGSINLKNKVIRLLTAKTAEKA
ncbi:hypothetical protein BF38_5491 (plasmid) [Bacillus thuringiensis]|uniref:Transposase n=1 Tax=Bacillus thuringiensis TaxID=1428 RepID=A0AB33B623_BACTU|nr:hypothetical protein BF38_5491 [Bacillus thuringiensis]